MVSIVVVQSRQPIPCTCGDYSTISFPSTPLNTIKTFTIPITFPISIPIPQAFPIQMT